MSRIELFDPCVDFVFKQIIGTNELCCTSLICAVLGWDKSQIKKLKFINKDILPDYSLYKEARLDVLVELENGFLIDIEIQVAHEQDFGKRALFYWSRLYGQHLKKGMQYDQLNKVICINIMNHNYFKQYSHFHNKFAIAHQDRLEFPSEFDDFLIHFIELPKFNGEWGSNDLSHWCSFLQHPEKVRDFMIDDEVFQQALEKLESLSLDDAQRALYQARVDGLRDIRSSIYHAEQKARQEGIQLGIEKERLLLAKKLLDQAVPVEIIQKTTSLSYEILNQLKNQ